MAKDLEFFMNKNYRVSLYFDPEGYWVAEHPELPGCIADGETAPEALSSLDITRELWMESRLATGLEIPEPQEEPQYSGKFVLRVAKSMHKELAREADVEGISLNTYVGNILAGRHAQKILPAATKEDFQNVVEAFLTSWQERHSPDVDQSPNSNVIDIAAIRSATISLQNCSNMSAWGNLHLTGLTSNSNNTSASFPTQGFPAIQKPYRQYTH